MELKQQQTRSVLESLQDEFLIYYGRILTWEEYNDSVWILLKNVEVNVHDPDLTGDELEEKEIKLDHLWVIQTHDVIKSFDQKLERLQTIRFQGKPYKYKRADGSYDYAISSIGIINYDEVRVLWNKAMVSQRWTDIIEISTYVIEGWEKHGWPLTTRTQSTNEIVAQHKEYIRRSLQKIKREDKLMRRRLCRKKAQFKQGEARGFL